MSDESKMVCNICDGKGCEPAKVSTHTIMQRQCWKCKGSGEVDWITYAMNKPPEPEYDFGLSGLYSTGSYHMYGNGAASTSYIVPNGVHDDALDAMSMALSAKIDEEIIDIIKREGNKIQNE